MWAFCGHYSWLDKYIWVGYGKVCSYKHTLEWHAMYDEIGVYAHNIDIVFSSTCNTMERGFFAIVPWSIKEHKIIHLEFV